MSKALAVSTITRRTYHAQEYIANALLNGPVIDALLQIREKLFVDIVYNLYIREHILDVLRADNCSLFVQ